MGQPAAKVQCNQLYKTTSFDAEHSISKIAELLVVEHLLGAGSCTYRPNPFPYPMRDCNHYDCDQKVFADDLPRWLAL